jgi:serine phosphatase RsbU (regulator of sigma subunit)
MHPDPLPADFASLPDVLSRAEEVLGALLDLSHELHPDDLASVVAAQASALGLFDVAVYLVDYDQRVLIALPVAGGRTRSPLEIDTTLAGRAFRRQEVVVGQAEPDAAHPEAPSGGVRVWIPMIDGAERLGILAATVISADEILLQRCRRLATIAAFMVTSKSLYGDGILKTRRLREMELAAEMRWAMLPPLTYSNDRVTISGVLEPAYEIAGDSFDYAVNGDDVDVAIFDAMGHGLEASRIANLAVMAYRHSRRHHGDLDRAFRVIDEVVAEQFGTERFVTGQMARLDMSTGRFRWINAGHPRPILLRNATNLVDLQCEICMPIGLGDVPSELSEASLEPGDTILFFTDGVTEARSPEGEEFGRGRLGDLLVRAVASDEAPPETMRRLSHAVLDHQEGRLQDDATLLMMRWTGPHRHS